MWLIVCVRILIVQVILLLFRLRILKFNFVRRRPFSSLCFEVARWCVNSESGQGVILKGRLSRKCQKVLGTGLHRIVRIPLPPEVSKTTARKSDVAWSTVGATYHKRKRKTSNVGRKGGIDANAPQNAQERTLIKAEERYV